MVDARGILRLRHWSGPARARPYRIPGSRCWHLERLAAIRCKAPGRPCRRRPFPEWRGECPEDPCRLARARKPSSCLPGIKGSGSAAGRVFGSTVREACRRTRRARNEIGRTRMRVARMCGGSLPSGGVAGKAVAALRAAGTVQRRELHHCPSAEAGRSVFAAGGGLAGPLHHCQKKGRAILPSLMARVSGAGFR